ncbi:ATP-dependent RNA helicase [Podochytrium sp. JEL0797]|nr:ATP-dependent RNA helicase [Podochytrium sp. JEL0797]
MHQLLMSNFTDLFPIGSGALDLTEWTLVKTSCTNVRLTDAQFYQPDTQNVNITQGGLTITALPQPTELDTCSLSRNYTSGRIHSNHCYRHGRFEAIARMPKGTYTWPAIWLQCYNCTDSNYFEIDMIEAGTNFGGSGQMSVFYSKDKTQPHGAFSLDPTLDLVDSYHNYTAVWTTGSVSFYLNEQFINVFDYSNLPNAQHMDSGCAMITINLALDGKGRNGVLPSLTDFETDQPNWTPLHVKSFQVWDASFVGCSSWECEHLQGQNRGGSNAREIPIAIAIGTFLAVLLVLRLANCSKLSMWNAVKALWTGVMIMALLAPAIVGYFMHWQLVSRGVYTLGVYGVFTMCHYSFQIICVILHKIRRANAAKEKLTFKPPVTAISNAVYREEPELFEACLESLKYMKRQNNKYIIVVADGQRPEDEYLVDVFLSVFSQDSVVLRLDTLENRRELHVPLNAEGKPYSHVFVTQPWGGKREAMYTAMSMVVNDPEVEAILTTDSDTVFDPEALNALSFELRNPTVAAVAGECRIINRWDSFVAYVSDVRYSFAFNIERACQSYHHAVVCVSGPIGMYRTAVLPNIMDRWVGQIFFKTQCTYGDDRHLTNLYLNEGWKIVYTPDAFCYTASPTTILAFFKQQTRWCKSFYREFAWSMPSFQKQSLWFGYEMTFQLVYPFMLLYWQLLILFTGTFTDQLVTVTIIAAFATIKALAAFLLGHCKEPKLFYYPFHFLFFITVLFPAKLLALTTLWDMSWGTRGMGNNWMNGIVLTLWNAMLLAGVALSASNVIRDTNWPLNLSERSVEPWEVVVGVVVSMLLAGYLAFLVMRWRVDKRKRGVKGRYDSVKLETDLQAWSVAE